MKTRYRRVRVGTDHPAAMNDGRAYEHRVIAMEKIGRPLVPGEEVHHINGDRMDNRLENLEILPSRESHARLHQAKITKEDAKRIRRLYGEGVTQGDIANIFGITQSNVSYICSGATWRDVR